MSLTPGIAVNGHSAIVHPTGLSANCEFLLRCERKRRREEGWQESNRGDDARLEIAETESSWGFPSLAQRRVVCCNCAYPNQVLRKVSKKSLP